MNDSSLNDPSLPETIEQAREEVAYYEGLKPDGGLWPKPQKMSKVCEELIERVTSTNEPFMPGNTTPNPWIGGSSGKSSGKGGGGGLFSSCVIL
jgi:hypothetical protein